MFREWPTFEELRKAAEENPEALEQFRQKEVQAIIDGAPVAMQRRLKGIQFQIDCKRRLHRASPLGSCISISKMMYQSVAQLQDVINGTSKSEPKTGNARVLPFPVTG